MSFIEKRKRERGRTQLQYPDSCPAEKGATAVHPSRTSLAKGTHVVSTLRAHP
jgi:hypothetical protein